MKNCLKISSISLEITRQVQQFLPTSALDSVLPTHQVTSGLVLRLSYLSHRRATRPPNVILIQLLTTEKKAEHFKNNTQPHSEIYGRFQKK